MNGIYRAGDELKALYAPTIDDNDSGLIVRVGEGGVTSIIVEKADGPMGHYAVAMVMRGDDLKEIYSLHHCSSVDV